MFKVVQTIEEDEDHAKTTYYSLIPEAWFSQQNCSSEETENAVFLYPPPGYAVLGVTAYNWPYKTFKRHYYPGSDWMEYDAVAIESGTKSGDLFNSALPYYNIDYNI